MRIISVLLLVFLVLVNLPQAAMAQQLDLDDVGQVYLENSGSPAAQQAFHHGLAQLHNFEYGSAARDFAEARRVDPDFALAYWGEAMTHTHPIWMEQDKDAALAILNAYAPTPEARQAKAPTELARDLFAAIDILYGPGEKEAQDDLYKDFMAKLFAKYPDNVEIAAFYALSIMGTAHEGREFALYMQAAAIMQEFITKYPRHPGVAHYLIHATDDPIHAPLGLNAANAYGDIAPNAAHAQHMTTHIFLALGDWEGVIRANVRASGLVNDHRAARDLGPQGCGHYPSWLMYGYLQIHEDEKAYDIMKLCQQNVREEPSRYNASYYSHQRALYLADTGEWHGDIANSDVDISATRNAAYYDLLTDGMVAIHQQDMGAADSILQQARDAAAAFHQRLSERGTATNHPDQVQVALGLRQLEALRLLAMGQTDDGIRLLREAVDMEMALPYGFGPPDPPKPSLELLAEALISAGQLEEAKALLKQAEARTPNKRAIRESLVESGIGAND